MNLKEITLGVFLVLASISQFFLDWVRFDHTGLVVIGIVGLVSGVLWVLDGLGRPLNL